MADKEWRCFHCDELFTNEEDARLHFGPNIQHQAICTIAKDFVRLFREQTEELQKFYREETEQNKFFYSMGAEHTTKLREAEEKGYLKGMTDMRDVIKERLNNADKLEIYKF